nr:putative molybdenum carrier protein [Thiolapillus sp.]
MKKPDIRIISGGQTGVDRAALDVALELGLRCGGWCPKGRLALDGPLDERYPLKETESADYSVRTRLNVRDADATLILNCGELSGGTAYTLRVAEELGRAGWCRIWITGGMWRRCTAGLRLTGFVCSMLPVPGKTSVLVSTAGRDIF